MPETIQVLPMDKHNAELVSHVHPADWKNPIPAPSYNLVVIGGGTAGLVCAAGAAGLGAKVALIERHLMGGDCLNFGCVPSKALISSSRAVADIKRAAALGVASDEVKVDFAKVMQRMRELRAKISQHDSAARFKELGVDVFIGEGKFIDNRHVEVDDRELKFSKAVICTGARAAHLPIDGLKETGYLTNETVFSLTEQPKQLAVIGAGPIGCELAQTFQRLGSEVSLIEMSPQILVREDRDAAAIVQKRFDSDGMNLILDAKTTKIEKTAQGKVIHYEVHGKTSSIVVDEILTGVGRAPNTEGLNLEAVGVEYDRTGVKVDDRLRTTNKRIFAAGDICMKYKFTHTADFAARNVLANALFAGRKKLSSLLIPWATYTDPEIAHVGMYESDAKDAGIDFDVYKREFKDVDRAMLEGATDGFVKIIVRKSGRKKGTILGATIVGAHAGDMISEITTAMAGGLSLGSIASVIHPYPTQAEAIRQLGDAYNRTRLTPFVKKLFRTWLSWTR